jgi:hypothetical protein
MVVDVAQELAAASARHKAALGEQQTQLDAVRIGTFTAIPVSELFVVRVRARSLIFFA